MPTLYDLMLSVAKRLGRFETGLATAASGTQMTDAVSFTEGSGFWTGGCIFISPTEPESVICELDGVPVYAVGQTFRVTVNTSVATMSVRLRKRGQPQGTVSCYIYDCGYGMPTTLLATSTTTKVESDLTNDFEWYDFTFSPACDLTALHTYAVTFVASEPSIYIDNDFEFGGPTATDAYTSGQAIQKLFGGVWLAISGTKDLSFKVNGTEYVNSSSVPGQSARISAHNAGGVFQYPLLQYTPAAGAEFCVTHKRVSRAILMEAVNTAVKGYGEIAVENESLYIVGAQVDYALPTAVQGQRVVGCWIEQQNDGLPYYEVPAGYWWIDAGRYLRFRSVDNFAAGKKIRLLYYGQHETMDQDQDDLSPDISSAFVLDRAIAECWLHLHRIEGLPEYERHANLQLQLAAEDRRLQTGRRLSGQLRGRQFMR